MQRMGVWVRFYFDATGGRKSTLKPLSLTRYVFSEWKKVREGADYHVTMDEHHYSVPYTLYKKN